MGTDNETTATKDETSADVETTKVETTSTKAETGETPETTTETVTSKETSTPSIDDTLKEIERLKTALTRANKEAKDHRVEATQLRAFKEKTEAEQLSEKEKLEKKVSDLQKLHEQALQQAKELKIEHAVSRHAQGLNFNDPDDAKRFMDLSALEFDESGDPTNVQALLAEVAKSKPYLIRAPATTSKPSSSGGATNPPRSSTSNDGRALSWELIAELQKDKTQFAARRSEIAQWMANPANQQRKR